MAQLSLSLLVDKHLGRAALQFEDLGDRVGDGLDQPAALFQRPAGGDMDGYEGHATLPIRTQYSSA